MNARRGRNITVLFTVLLITFRFSDAIATVPDPGGGGDPSPPMWLDYWSFNNTNTWQSDRGYAPLSFTNLDVSFLGNWTALSLDNPNPAWLRYKVVEDDGTNHIKVDRGCVMFWFAPYWSGTNKGGSGPEQWARLIEVGQYTTDASYGWWSVFTDPEGVNLYFCAQTNGAGATFLSAPIEWTTNRWHLIALNYSATNTQLYLDGTIVTNGAGITVWPGPDVLSNGFTIGSDATGIAQARGMFDELITYGEPQSDGAIAGTFIFSSFYYYMNPANFANLMSSAGSSPSYAGAQFNAITGTGFLGYLTNEVPCLTNSSYVWITNVVAYADTNGALTVEFEIGGGLDGFYYDVFANSILTPASSTNRWAWMGQGPHCQRYCLRNFPNTAAFLILGTLQDSDFDGLTDAYENLVSKTDPNNPDSDGDGILDGWAVMWGLNPNGSESSQADKRANYTYDASGWLQAVFGLWSEGITLDAEGNIRTLE